MKITDALLGEHGVFYGLMRHVEEAAPLWDDTSETRAAAAMLVSVLKTHADLEDEILFHLLEPDLGKQNSILSILRIQHEEIEVTLAKVIETELAARARELLLCTLDLIRDHFEREERDLFPEAERLLGPDRLIRLGAQWAERRGVRLTSAPLR